MAQIDMTRIRQLVNSGLPFDPFSGAEIGGASLNRLVTGMQALKWTDLRFITRDDAQRLGWEIAEDAKSVQVRYSDGRQGEVFNASNVWGMLSLDDMLAMKDEDLDRLQSEGPSQDAEEELRVMPAGRAVEQQSPTVDAQPEPAASARSPSGRYLVSAPYWLDGLHNHAGLAMAKELNETIRRAGITRDPKAMERLLEGRERAGMYELRIISEEEHERDTDFWRNLAEPEYLLAGDLVRDKEGGYRPKGGGRQLILDEGESLVIKSKSGQAYQAAIELAKAKGWTAIELSGKGKMLADAWLEAKVAGIDVVNFKPSQEDEKRLAERLAQEAVKAAEQQASAAAAKAEQQEAPAPTPDIEPEQAKDGPAPMETPLPIAALETSAEQVEVHPYVDADGQQKTANVVYTVVQEGQPDQRLEDPKEAAKAFFDAPGKNRPAVVRAVLRTEGQPGEEMIAGVEQKGRNKFIKSADSVLDPEFHQAFSELQEKEKGNSVSKELFTGLVLRVEGDEVVQKIGRKPTDVKRHPISKLSRLPAIGEIVDIAYGKDGIAQVSDKQAELELGR